jgi:hypothetical protein
VSGGTRYHQGAPLEEVSARPWGIFTVALSAGYSGYFTYPESSGLNR